MMIEVSKVMGRDLVGVESPERPVDRHKSYFAMWLTIFVSFLRESIVLEESL